jgi:hypothetical protein
MGWKKDDSGGLRWDRSTASERWGKNANRPDFVEAAEHFLDRGMINCLWDTLANPDYRPADLGEDEERMLVRKALARSVEVGRMNGNAAAVLLRLIGGSDRLKTENKDPKKKAQAISEIRATPGISLGRLAQKYHISRDTASRWKKDALSDN